MSQFHRKRATAEIDDMAYYVIFDVTIHDLPKYQEYMEKIKPVIKALRMEASSANIMGVEGF